MASTLANPSASNLTSSQEHQNIYMNVQDHYGEAAKDTDTQYGTTVASAFGYSEEELASVPPESNLGLSCGNPFAIARLREGETVIDLGSGAGFDVFQAARKVGSSGRAIGVDMNKDMLSRAEGIKAKTDADNVSFIESPITKINLPDATANCIISNCVVNLVPEAEKQLVFNEMFRLLKPGGRVAVSDILLKKDLPSELKGNVALYVGCISGASHKADYERYLGEAGFHNVLIVGDQSDLNIYKIADGAKTQGGCCGPSSKKQSSCQKSSKPAKADSDLQDVDFNEWAGSYKIYAVKPHA